MIAGVICLSIAFVLFSICLVTWFIGRYDEIIWGVGSLSVLSFVIAALSLFDVSIWIFNISIIIVAGTLLIMWLNPKQEA